MNQPQTGLCIDAETLAAAEVDVHGHPVTGPIGVVRFAGGTLTLQSHHLSPHTLADGLRDLAQRLDDSYWDWLNSQAASRPPCPAGGEHVWVEEPGPPHAGVRCDECGATQPTKTVTVSP